MFSAKRLQCVVLLMVILSVLTSKYIVEVHAAPDFWSIETVDSEASVGWDSSIALDANGYPHISYRDYTYHSLRYAQWNGLTWEIETVDSGGDITSGFGKSSSLALDSNGYAHISYYDNEYDNLKYARWTGSIWSIQTVDSDEYTGEWSSLVLDGNDYPHISYYRKWYDDYYKVWYGQLKYTLWTGSEWDINTVDSGGDVGMFSSLALDSNGYAHISYYDYEYDNQDLKYAWWSGTNWNIELVDSGGRVGMYSSLALDANGYPHISYYDQDLTALKYARWNGIDWTYNIVDNDRDVGEYTSLALDGNGYPHISYHDRTNQDLKYARWTGSIWSIQTVDSDKNVGFNNAIALDANGYPHISYFNGTTFGALKYAFAPDEYFSDINLVPFDSNGDGFNDAVEVEMNVDTTYSGTLDVYVDADLSNPVYGIVDSNSVGWSITGTAVDYSPISLGTQPGSTAGGYDIELYLYDGDDNLEDQAFLIEPVYLYPPTTSFESCTSLGVQQDSFELEESIYVTGTDFAPSSSFAVYVVVDTAWTDGMTIPSRVAGTANSITSNTGGDIEVTEIWSSPLTLGRYDVVVDVDGNSRYDMGVDALDDSDIEVTAGVEVIPEFPIAMLVPVLAGLSLIAVVVKKRLMLN